MNFNILSMNLFQPIHQQHLVIVIKITINIINTTTTIIVIVMFDQKNIT